MLISLLPRYGLEASLSSRVITSAPGNNKQNKRSDTIEYNIINESTLSTPKLIFHLDNLQFIKGLFCDQKVNILHQ